jgi:nitrite reductase (NADH) large subunit
VHCNARIAEVLGDADGRVSGLSFSNEEAPLDVGMVVVSAGIRPRDEIARASGISVHERGGIQVDNALRTSDADVFAIGECALHG